MGIDVCPFQSKECYAEYYKKHRDEILARHKERRKKHGKKIREIERKSYQKNKAKIKRRRQKRFKVIRLKVLKYYGGNPPKCACCGESHIEFLDIDHVSGGGTEHRRKIQKFGIYFYYWLIKNNFPSGYRVLCSNCNSSIGRYGYCPHEKEKKKFG